MITYNLLILILRNLQAQALITIRHYRCKKDNDEI